MTNDPLDPNRLRMRLSRRMLGAKLVENRWRGDLVEEIVKDTLARVGWKHCSENWNSWDFQHEERQLKLQVKQAAQLQTWGESKDVRFSVSPAKGYYEEGTIWRRLPFPQRLAELYVFAYHPLKDDTANHWDARQWRFHVWPEVDIPPGARSVSLDFVQKKRPGQSEDLGLILEHLGSQIDQMAALVRPNGRTDDLLTGQRPAVDDVDPLGGAE
ncbi:MAG: hypothetical protein AB7O44_05470 [Hyphomicrobiaceae bacterium]